MRYLHTLLLVVALGFFLACGNVRQAPIPHGMRGLELILEHSAVSPGDHVDVIIVDNERETTVLTNIRVVGVTLVDKHSDAVSLVASEDETEQLTFAVKSASKQHKFQLHTMTTN